MALPLRNFLSLLVLSTVLALFSAVTASAQWMVYDMRMHTDEAVSVNFVPYTGAYLIAPVNGGPASLVFTTESGGRYYAVAESAGRYFVAANPTKRRAVFSASANSGTSLALYQASGPLNSTRAYQVNNTRQVATIAADLYGQLMSSDDEHLATVPASDGSLGVVGSASFTGFFRKDLSDKMDAEAPSMGLAIGIITGLLEKYGYLPDTDEPAMVTTSVPQPSPAPAPPVENEGPDGSLFPAGSREDMEQALRQEATK